MDLYNLFKSLLGLPNSVPPHDFASDRYKNYPQDDDINVFRGQPESDEDSIFRIFSDPVEMQRYFEQQMNDIMRTFGIPTEGSIFGSFDLFGDHKPPAIEGSDIKPPAIGNLREQYLKRGYEYPATTDKAKTDYDVDGRADMSELDTILKQKNIDENEITPYQRPSQRNFFFGQSVMSKTIQNSDGTIEKHRTVRDNQGNEETTVTYKKGEQEYTVVTKTDKNGKQEKQENFLNLDENDIHRFLGKSSASVPPENNQNWFDFDKYFK